MAGVEVAFNRIHDIGRNSLSDMAGIYAVGPQPGSVYNNNLVYNISCGGNGAHAFYIDQACTGTTWSNNVGRLAQSALMHVNYGLNNTVVNNIFLAGDFIPGPGAWPCK